MERGDGRAGRVSGSERPRPVAPGGPGAELVDLSAHSSPKTSESQDPGLSFLEQPLFQQSFMWGFMRLFTSCCPCLKLFGNH